MPKAFNENIKKKLASSDFSSALKDTHIIFCFYLDNINSLGDRGPIFLGQFNLSIFGNYSQTLDTLCSYIYQTVQCIFLKSIPADTLLLKLNALLETNLSYDDRNLQNALSILCASIERTLSVQDSLIRKVSHLRESLLPPLTLEHLAS